MMGEQLIRTKTAEKLSEVSSGYNYLVSTLKTLPEQLEKLDKQYEGIKEEINLYTAKYKKIRALQEIITLAPKELSVLQPSTDNINELINQHIKSLEGLQRTITQQIMNDFTMVRSVEDIGKAVTSLLTQAQVVFTSANVLNDLLTVTEYAVYNFITTLTLQAERQGELAEPQPPRPVAYGKPLEEAVILTHIKGANHKWVVIDPVRLWVRSQSSSLVECLKTLRVAEDIVITNMHEAETALENKGFKYYVATKPNIK